MTLGFFYGILLAMKNFFSNLFNRWSVLGIKFPYAYDGDTKGSSVTLFFAYVSFILTCISIICYHFYDKLLGATLTTLGFWSIAMVFHLVRSGFIKKAKFDLDDKSFELEGNDNDKRT